MKKITALKVILGIYLVLCSLNYAFSEDTLKLNSNDGSTKIIVRNKDAAAVFSADSNGNTVINGTAAIRGSEFSISGSTFVVKGGNAGIGTAAPGARLDVRGTDTQAYNLAVGTSSTAYSLVVSTNGNVGIGTTVPVYKMQIDGKLGLKTDGTNTGELKVDYAVTSPAGYYAVYAPD